MVDNIDEALEALKQAEQIYEYNYSVVDKRTCKVKRNIALLYLKANKYDEALEELKEVEVKISKYITNLYRNLRKVCMGTIVFNLVKLSKL